MGKNPGFWLNRTVRKPAAAPVLVAERMNWTLVPSTLDRVIEAARDGRLRECCSIEIAFGNLATSFFR